MEIGNDLKKEKIILEFSNGTLVNTMFVIAIRRCIPICNTLQLVLKSIVSPN
ncbi:MAG: hypothetical protein IPN94_10770 [Sphingobacteriales bacterium]|nr:hypothetical protein [Sphingobacteriales bacterium]